MNSPLNIAVSEWALDGRRTVSPAERIRRAQAAAAPTVIAAPKRFSRRWMVWSLSAALVLISVVIGRLQFSQHAPAPTVADIHSRHEAAAVGAATDATAGLHRCAAGETVWAQIQAQGPIRAGDLVQTPINGKAAVLKLWGHVFSLAAGTLIRIGADAKSPHVDLWRGTMKVTTGDSPLSVGTVAKDGHSARMETLKTDNTYELEAECDAEQTFILGTYQLLQPDSLSVSTFHIRGPENRTPLNKPVPQPIEENVSKLLELIDCDYNDKPATDVVADLRTRIGLQIILSPQAETQFGKKLVTLKLNRVTGANAVKKLADALGLVPITRAGALTLELPAENDAIVPKTPDF